MRKVHAAESIIEIAHLRNVRVEGQFDTCWRCSNPGEGTGATQGIDR